MNYKFSRDVIKKQHKHKWILLNTLNGESIVISNECFDILEIGINKSIVIDNIIDMLEDVEDKEYFKHLFSMLRNSNIIVNKHKKEKWEIDTISVDVTHRCNLNCLHCSACSGTIQEKEHLSTDTVIKILSDVIKLKPKNICITGGEPLVRKDIWELLNYIKKNRVEK